MFDFLYEWIMNIAFYMVLVTAVIQAVPGKDYKKYVRFFTGLLLVLLLAAPIFKIFGMEDEIAKLYDSEAYKEKLEEIEETTSYLNDIDASEYLPENVPGDAADEAEQIKVEEIEIGK